ncbi:ribosome-associated translation inhibitor RaiA [Candidatus Gracilibacteria bacterium]|nr:ribosome-associated translation inhibitor RaiA [Candidatus Gracilibacteria bacterium]
MELTIKSRNGKVTERQREHIEEKLGKLERYIKQLTSATVEVSSQQTRVAGEVYRVQVTLVGDHGIIVRAEEQSADLYAAIDEVQASLQRQITRYKEKHWRRGKLRRQGAQFVEANGSEAVTPSAVAANGENSLERQITRVKEFRLRPMFTDDAVEQMELLGHSFFVFQDAETARVSVVYRRRDGNYGLIVPDAV